MTAKETLAECTQFIYIGPSLPGGLLKNNAVLCGTKQEIFDYYADALNKFPQTEKLIVPVSCLGSESARVRSSGNIMNKYYNGVAATIKKHIQSRGNEVR